MQIMTETVTNLVTQSSSTPLLELRQVSCARDSRVLFSGLDCSVGQGEILQIEGPNGAGKTTLLRALTMLFPEYDGEILWRGQLVSKSQYDFLSHLLFIGHLPGIKKSLTPRENLAFLANLQGHYDIEQIDQALAQVGLYGYEDMPGHQLSAGQNRRIALARLYLSHAANLCAAKLEDNKDASNSSQDLSQSPSQSLWILDEPYTALDAQGIKKLEQLFTDHAQHGGSVIMTSHQPPQIEGLKRLSLENYQPARENA